MIKRLNKNTLVEFISTHNNLVSWRIIITDKGTREVYLSCLHLKKIRKWEEEFKEKVYE